MLTPAEAIWSFKDQKKSGFRAACLSFVELDCGSEVEEGSLPLCSDLEQSVTLVVDV
jgi:hypothetical protein